MKIYKRHCQALDLKVYPATVIEDVEISLPEYNPNFDSGGGNTLKVSYQPDGSDKKEIPASLLFHI